MLRSDDLGPGRFTFGVFARIQRSGQPQANALTASKFQRQIRLLGDQREQPIFVRLDRSRAAVTTGWLGLPATRLLEVLCPASSAADTEL